MKLVRISSLVVVLSSAGCASLQPVRDPARFIAEARPGVVHVTHVSGAVLVVTAPQVRGDTLVGTRQGIARPVALPLTHVQRIEAIQRDRRRTTFLIAGGTAVAATLAYVLLQPASGNGASCDYTHVTHPFPDCPGRGQTQ
jgi:hypothetical protein